MHTLQYLQYIAVHYSTLAVPSQHARMLEQRPGDSAAAWPATQRRLQSKAAGCPAAVPPPPCRWGYDYSLGAAIMKGAW